MLVLAATVPGTMRMRVPMVATRTRPPAVTLTMGRTRETTPTATPMLVLAATVPGTMRMRVPKEAALTLTIRKAPRQEKTAPNPHRSMSTTGTTTTPLRQSTKEASPTIHLLIPATTHPSTQEMNPGTTNAQKLRALLKTPRTSPLPKPPTLRQTTAPQHRESE